MKITLEMTEAQALVLEKALDMYSRTLCGQFEVIPELFYGQPAAMRLDGDYDDREFHPVSRRREWAANLIAGLKDAIVACPRNGHLGIHNPIVDDRARVAYDILQVVRHDRAKREKPKDSLCRWLDEPHVTSTTELTLPVVSAVPEVTEKSRMELSPGALVAMEKDIISLYRNSRALRAAMRAYVKAFQKRTVKDWFYKTIDSIPAVRIACALLAMPRAKREVKIALSGDYDPRYAGYRAVMLWLDFVIEHEDVQALYAHAYPTLWRGVNKEEA